MSDKIYLKEITLPIVETGENETYSFVQTDDDLETAGDAADAKAVGDELTNLKQDFNKVQSGELPYNLIANSYVTTTGVISSYSGWSRTDYIPVNKYAKLTLQSTVASEYNCFYDEQKQFLSSFRVRTYKKEIVVPDDAYYVILSNSDTGMANLEAVFTAKTEALANKTYEDVEYIYDKCFIKETGVITETGTTHINTLNNAYVWLRTEPLPKGSIPTIIAWGEAGAIGNATIYFFKKNSNDTYTLVDSVNIRTDFGNTPVNVPVGLTDNDDIYVGVYSENSGLSYSSGSQYATSYTRCPISAVSSSEIEMSGSFDLDFSIKISYVLYTMPTENIVIVDPNGKGKYTTVIDAITSEPENTVIHVRPGVYNQDMTDCLKKRIILIGTDRNQCIIRDTDGRYGHHALYVSCGYFENLTIEEPYVSGTSQEIGMGLGGYAVHVDTDGDYAIGKQLEFYHCNIRSDFFPAVGVGLRKDMTLILDDCMLENNQVDGRGDYSDEGTLGALYFHDSNGAQGNQYVVLKNNVFKSKLKYALCPYQVYREPQNNRVYCDFINNVLYSDVGKYTDTVWFRGDPFNAITGIFSIGIGYGNSIASLNNN